MDNIQNQEIIDKYMNEIFNILNSDNELDFVVITPSLKNMIFTLYQTILKEKRASKFNRFIATLFQENFRIELYKTNIGILETELSSYRFLIVNFHYLNDFNKELLNHYFTILKYMLEIDFLRNEWLSQNSNDGRTIFNNYKITEMSEYYTKASIEYEKIAELKDNKDKTKGLNLNAK